MLLIPKDIRKRYGVDTPARLAWFYAHLQHHSMGFTELSLSYAYPQGHLIRTYPILFPDKKIAHRYEYREHRICNRIYAGYYGNGAEKTGEGYRYRERGLFKLLGKREYGLVSEHLKVDLLAEPERLLQKDIAFKAGLWFWQYRKLYEYADRDNVEGVLFNLHYAYYRIQELRELYGYYRFMQFDQQPRYAAHVITEASSR